ncbi:MAG: tetratricopeptide repeat protein [Armatimonadota bacterium]|nr:tetratricopeptide repeat protein [Armatimonadota bacterium]
MKIIQISLLAVCCAVVSSCFQPSAVTTTSNDFLSFAASEGNASDANLIKWRQAVERDPKSVRSINQLGEGLLQKGRETGDIEWYVKSKAAFEAAHALDADDWRTLSNLAWISTVYHDFQSAIKFANQSLEVRPENAQAYGILTDSHLELGHYEDAAETCQKMIDIHPSLASYSRAAQVRVIYGNNQGAIEMYKRAIESGAQFPENVAWCRTMMGDLHVKTGALRSAEEVYRTVLRGNPQNRLALAGMGRISVAKKDIHSAVEYFEQATQGAAPPSFLYELGELYKVLGKDSDANRAFTRFTDRLAEYRKAGIGGDEVMRITYWLDCGTNQKEALALAKSEVEQHKNIPTYTALAWAYAANGVPKDATRAAEQALRTGVQDPITLYRLAKVYEMCGDRRRARTLANAALGMNSGFHAKFADDAREILGAAKVVSSAR